MRRVSLQSQRDREAADLLLAFLCTGRNVVVHGHEWLVDASGATEVIEVLERAIETYDACRFPAYPATTRR